LDQVLEESDALFGLSRSHSLQTVIGGVRPVIAEDSDFIRQAFETVGELARHVELGNLIHEALLWISLQVQAGGLHGAPGHGDGRTGGSHAQAPKGFVVVRLNGSWCCRSVDTVSHLWRKVRVVPNVESATVAP
jgi:hypothetical protein